MQYDCHLAQVVEQLQNCEASCIAQVTNKDSLLFFLQKEVMEMASTEGYPVSLFNDR